MNKRSARKILLAGLLAILLVNSARAGDVSIVAADFRSNGGQSWSVDVTLRHDDSGWDHYADEWRVVDGSGRVLGDRVLYHPHANEQPFTRGLGGVVIPAADTLVFVEAHDKQHGWASRRLAVDLGEAVDGYLRVEAE